MANPQPAPSSKSRRPVTPPGRVTPAGSIDPGFGRLAGSKSGRPVAPPGRVTPPKVVDPGFGGLQRPDLQNSLSGAQRDAYVALTTIFKGYGLESLAGKIYEYVKDGYSGDTISILLQDTPEYKKRFAGNEIRKQQGLPVLTPQEYLATEASYQQIMRQAGLPTGYYDHPDDFANWIGKDVSPSEIQSRVDLATQATTLANPAYKQALNQMGIDDSHLAAYFLDQNRAMPFLQKAAATAAIGAAAITQGVAFDQSYAEQLATAGVSQSQAQQGYQNIAASMQTMQSLGQIYGQSWSQREAEQAEFQGMASAVEKKGRLLSQERGAFSGATGAARGLGGLAQAKGAQ